MNIRRKKNDQKTQTKRDIGKSRNNIQFWNNADVVLFDAWIVKWYSPKYAEIIWDDQDQFYPKKWRIRAIKTAACACSNSAKGKCSATNKQMGVPLMIHSSCVLCTLHSQLTINWYTRVHAQRMMMMTPMPINCTREQDLNHSTKQSIFNRFLCSFICWLSLSLSLSSRTKKKIYKWIVPVSGWSEGGIYTKRNDLNEVFFSLIVSIWSWKSGWKMLFAGVRFDAIFFVYFLSQKYTHSVDCNALAHTSARHFGSLLCVHQPTTADRNDNDAERAWIVY